MTDFQIYMKPKIEGRNRQFYSNSWRLQCLTLNNRKNRRHVVNRELNTIKQRDLTDIYRTLSNNCQHILLKCTWDIFQHRQYIRPQIKYQQILKDRYHTECLLQIQQDEIRNKYQK